MLRRERAPLRPEPHLRPLGEGGVLLSAGPGAALEGNHLVSCPFVIGQKDVMGGVAKLGRFLSVFISCFSGFEQYVKTIYITCLEQICNFIIALLSQLSVPSKTQ